jgi:hypothetical protein
MPLRSTALTGAAGEHFVAYKLSAMGYPVALTRGGSPTVDLMVGDLQGGSPVSIQVKTSTGAWRERKRDAGDSRWEWDVGKKALTLRGDSIFYAFVDLKSLEATRHVPDVFIVPSGVVAKYVPPGSSRYMFWLPESVGHLYSDKWNRITDLLDGKRGDTDGRA